MTNKSKKVLVSIGIILATVTIILRIGSYISHRTPNQGQFIGQVGKNTDVYNLTNKDVGLTDAEYMWHGFNRGAPGPFLLMRTYKTKRIEIIDSNFDQHKRCGSFQINVYTYFNKKQFDNLRVNEPCP